MNSPTPDKLEYQAYRTVTDHGFYDLLLGAGLIVFTLAIITSPWATLVVIPLILAKQPLLKGFSHRIVEPRIGHVRLNAVRMDQISTARKVAAIAFFGVAFTIHRLEETARPFVWLDDHAPVQMALIAGIAIATTGWLFGLHRFLLYALVVLVAPIATTLAGLPGGFGWMIATLIVLCAGGFVLYRFLQCNPVES